MLSSLDLWCTLTSYVVIGHGPFLLQSKTKFKICQNWCISFNAYIHNVNIYSPNKYIYSTNENFYSAWKSSALAPFVKIVVCLCHHEKWKIQLFCCTNMEMKTSEENLQKLFHASILRSDKILSGNWVLEHLSEISYISCTHSETFKRRGKVRIMVCMLFVSFFGFGDET